MSYQQYSSYPTPPAAPNPNLVPDLVFNPPTPIVSSALPAPSAMNPPTGQYYAPVAYSYGQPAVGSGAGYAQTYSYPQTGYQVPSATPVRVQYANTGGSTSASTVDGLAGDVRGLSLAGNWTLSGTDVHQFPPKLATSEVLVSNTTPWSRNPWTPRQLLESYVPTPPGPANPGNVSGSSAANANFPAFKRLRHWPLPAGLKGYTALDQTWGLDWRFDPTPNDPLLKLDSEADAVWAAKHYIVTPVHRVLLHSESRHLCVRSEESSVNAAKILSRVDLSWSVFDPYAIVKHPNGTETRGVYRPFAIIEFKRPGALRAPDWNPLRGDDPTIPIGHGAEKLLVNSINMGMPSRFDIWESAIGSASFCSASMVIQTTGIANRTGKLRRRKLLGELF